MKISPTFSYGGIARSAKGHKGFPGDKKRPLRRWKRSLRASSASLTIFLVAVTAILSAYQTLFYSNVSKLVVEKDSKVRRIEHNSNLRYPNVPGEKGLSETLEDVEHNGGGQNVDSGTAESEDELAGRPLSHAFVQPEKWSRDDDSIVILNDLWHGRPSFPFGAGYDPGQLVLHGVLSLCLGDLGWLRGYLEGHVFRSFTVISKCGVTPGNEQLPDGAQVLPMRNVGRVDHTVAHYIARLLPSINPENDLRENEIIVFLKDNINVHTEASLRDFSTMLKYAYVDGFSCALEPRIKRSFFHLTDMLATFSMEDYSGVPGVYNSPNEDPNDVEFKSKHKNMGAWLREMGIVLPQPLSPVCYGGNFAAKRVQIDKVPPQVWLNMERSLSRGDSIEEGHFAERTWAGLLYRPLTQDERELLFERMDHLALLNIGMRGALMK